MASYKMNTFKISKSYYLNEFQCPCCGTVKIANRLVELLEQFIKLHNIKPKINSAYRCEKHNKAVGGVPNSYHVQGLAVDLSVPDGMNIDDFAKKLENIGFNGIGIYRNKKFVHVDLGTKRKWEE